MSRFQGKVAVVTGGAAGIGRAVVEELCSGGCTAAFLDRDMEAGTKAMEYFSSQGYRVEFYAGDIGDEAFCRNACSQIVQQAGGAVHYLVNNAFSFLAKGIDATKADWERMFEVGPQAFALMAQCLVPAMKLVGGGAIVNVASISAYIAQPNRWTYNTAKGAVLNLTRCMAFDLAPFGIRVNSVSPAWIWTQEVYKIAGGDRQKWEPVFGKFHMLRRCGEPSEVAHAIAFLLSDEASFITATDLRVEGGYLGLGGEGLGDHSKFAGTD
jgi:NAD(P)-dependent dehydrogenase (short-subunit alcohol dehydrogenase family)